MFYVTLAIVALCYAVYWFCTRQFDYWKKRNIKGPEPRFFFGNMKNVFLRRSHVGDHYKEIYDQFKNEKVIGFFRMKTPCLLVTDLDLIKEVMIRDFDNFADRGISFSQDGLGANLFHADEEIWRLLRSKFSPIFTSGKLKNMYHLLEECSDRFVEYLTVDSVIATEYEAMKILKMYTIVSISACAFGMDIDYHDKNKMDAFNKLDEDLFTANYLADLDCMFPGILKKINQSLFPADVTEFFNNLVKTAFTQRNFKPTDRKDFIDLILELRQLGELQHKDENNKTSLKITESVTAAQAFVFFAAGYETSATTMTFLMYNLAMHLDVQDKLIAEIDEVTKRHGGKITYDSLSEMSYMHKVFEETLRMYPIVDTLIRVSKDKYTFPGTDFTIEKGQTILVPVVAIHRDERYYPNPDIFDPERFSPENVGNRHSCAYLPFGIGQRNCIGMRFGKLQSYTCIAKLLSKFRVEPSPTFKKEIRINPRRGVYSVTDGVHLNLIQRKMEK